MYSSLPGGGPRIRNGQLENRPFADYEQRMGGMAGYNSIVPDALVVSRYWTPDHFDGLARKANLPRQLVRLVAATVAQGSVQRVLLRLPFDRWLAYDPVKDARSSVTVHAEVGSGDGTVRRCTIRGEAIYPLRSEEHTSELQSLMRISYAVFCLKKKKHQTRLSIRSTQ